MHSVCLYSCYSQAVVVDNTMYISGQVGMDLSGNLVTGGLEAEAEQVQSDIYSRAITLWSILISRNSAHDTCTWGCGPVVRLLGCHARARRSLPSHCRKVPSHVALP